MFTWTAADKRQYIFDVLHVGSIGFFLYRVDERYSW